MEDMNAPGGVRRSPDPERSKGSMLGAGRLRDEVGERLKGLSRDLRIAMGGDWLAWAGGWGRAGEAEVSGCKGVRGPYEGLVRGTA